MTVLRDRSARQTLSKCFYGCSLVTYKYYLFDLDGTLTDPGIGITNSVMYALERFDIHVSDRSELYPFIGPPLDESFQRFFGFSESQCRKAIEYYRERYRDTGLFENSVYPGIPELLSSLKEKNITVALATSKPYEFSVRILRHFDLYDSFDFIGAATMDGSISRKSDVIKHLLNEIETDNTEFVLMIGDRAQDINGAKTNGLKSAGVLWGYGSSDELLNAGADYLISRPEELLYL